MGMNLGICIGTPRLNVQDLYSPDLYTYIHTQSGIVLYYALADIRNVNFIWLHGVKQAAKAYSRNIYFSIHLS